MLLVVCAINVLGCPPAIEPIQIGSEGESPCYTGFVATLTLSIPEELLNQALVEAKLREQSVEAFLGEIVRRELEAKPDWFQRREELKARLKVDSSWKWNRDELYEN